MDGREGCSHIAMAFDTAVSFAADEGRARERNLPFQTGRSARERMKGKKEGGFLNFQWCSEEEWRLVVWGSFLE